MSKAQRYQAITDIGCLVCRLFYGVYTRPAIHHLVGLKYRSLGKKSKDEHSIGLCPCHHQYGSIDHPAIHSHPAEFEKRFGTQEELLNITNELIKKNNTAAA